ncbi:MAG: endolytic transglycosylase MltG [Reyranellaceae bacterium]
MSRIVLRLLLTLIVGVALAAAGAWLYVQNRLEAPGPLAASKVVVVPKGTGSGEIGALLERQGVIDDDLLFRFALRLDRDRRPLRAGEYEFAAGTTIKAAIEQMQAGRTVVRRFTVPEGLTVAEVLKLVREVEGLEGDVSLRPAEGTLLPETYHYSLGDSRDSVVQRMRQAMTEILDAAWARRRDDLPLASKQEALTLASIVEKETGVASERPRVAAVFVNRLRLGMRLESDPTIIYGITKGSGPLDRTLTRTDVQTPSAYNTYTIPGLPPGPIANPGKAAIEATLAPIKSKELYFVADGTGGHAFAETLEQHNRNVAAWRRFQREQKK